MLASFDALGGADTSWSEEARVYIRAAAQSDGSAAVDEALALQGQPLEAAGCDNPIVLYWLGTHALKTGEMDRATSMLERAGRGLLGKPDAALIQFFVGRDGYSAASKLKGWREGWPWFCLARDSMADAITSGTFDTEGTQFAFRWMNDFAQQSWNTDAEFWGVIRRKINTSPQKVDPWLDKMIEGESETQRAWDDRGSELAFKVTDQEWAGFHGHTAKARQALEAAWRMHPDRPEAATSILTPCLGLERGQASALRLWFDRARAAQYDYAPAYQKLSWGLRPRWFGSWDEMRELGEECLDEGRYETLVPMNYLRILRDIGSDIPGGRWRTVFRAPGVAENLEKMFDGYASRPEYEVARSRLLAQRAVAMAWCGRYAEAKRLLAEVPADVDFDRELYSNPPISFRQRPREMVQAEVRVFTGPAAGKLAEAEKAELAGSITEAVQAFTAVLESIDDDPAAQAYLRDRIVIMQLKNDEGEPLWAAEGEPLLLYASTHGNADLVTFMLDHGADVNMTNAVGRTPLHGAATAGREKVAELLLARGAAIDAEDAEGRTPLDSALKAEQQSAADLLIARGARPARANVTPRDPNKDSSLWAAAQNGSVADVGRLLQEGAAPDGAVSNTGTTALMVATAGGHAEVVRTLLESGANAAATDNQSWSVLHAATAGGHAGIVQVLLDHGSDPKAKDGAGLTPLAHAVLRQDIAVMKVLLSGDASPDAEVAKGRRMLHYAVAKDDRALVETLIDGGAGLNKTDDSKQTPLTVALNHDFQTMALFLLEKGADPKKADGNRWQPLHYACLRSQSSIARRVVDAGADVNVVASGGWTPLQIAVVAGDAAVVSILIEKGADVRTALNGDWTALGNYYKGYFGVDCVPLLADAESSTHRKPPVMPLTAHPENRAALLTALEVSPAWRQWLGGEAPAQ